jgi:hypothetical protein
MIVELNDANALRDRSNTYKQVESAVDYMGAKKEQSPWVVHISHITERFHRSEGRSYGYHIVTDGDSHR